MMKRLLTISIVWCCMQGVSAQVVDAFQGVLPVTDPAMKKSLNGEWSIKVVEGITDDTTVPAADTSWGVIPVPGCWEAYGFCKPRYDSPNPLTGYYRTSFTIPTEWKGMRTMLRFDGVLYGYDLWVNGKAVGSWRSGYNSAMLTSPRISTKSQTPNNWLSVSSANSGAATLTTTTIGLPTVSSVT